MSENSSKYQVLHVVLVNIIFIFFIFIGFELYLRYCADEAPVTWRVAGFCSEARGNNYVFVDKTMYRNDGDGIYKYNRQADTEYLAGKYNNAGFTGNDLVPVITDKSTILFIGDSHTFGVAARPILKKRFVSLVENAGFYTYDAGIGGLDVVQYGLIADKFIPALKPDYVALMLYLGNDINRPPSPVAPGKHLHFQTNFGWIQGYDRYGYSFLDAAEAVDHWLKIQCASSLEPWVRFLFKSRVIHMLYLFYYDYIKSLYSAVQVNDDNEWVARTILHIMQLASKENAKFLLFVIPEKTRLAREEIESDIRFLRNMGLTPVYPVNLGISDYQVEGGHMLNSGHRKYADFILKILDSDE